MSEFDPFKRSARPDYLSDRFSAGISGGAESAPDWPDASGKSEQVQTPDPEPQEKPEDIDSVVVAEEEPEVEERKSSMDRLRESEERELQRELESIMQQQEDEDRRMSEPNDEEPVDDEPAMADDGEPVLTQKDLDNLVYELDAMGRLVPEPDGSGQFRLDYDTTAGGLTWSEIEEPSN